MAQIIVLPEQTAAFSNSGGVKSAAVNDVDFSKLSDGDIVHLSITAKSGEYIYDLVYSAEDNSAATQKVDKFAILTSDSVAVTETMLSGSASVFATAEISGASGSKMTNSEALKELLVAVGGTEPEETKTNLELLNAISEQLGGDADAESNAEAIHNIAQNASGGGVQFSEITVHLASNFPMPYIEVPAVVDGKYTYTKIEKGSSGKAVVPIVEDEEIGDFIAGAVSLQTAYRTNYTATADNGGSAYISTHGASAGAIAVLYVQFINVEQPEVTIGYSA